MLKIAANWKGVLPNILRGTSQGRIRCQAHLQAHPCLARTWYLFWEKAGRDKIGTTRLLTVAKSAFCNLLKKSQTVAQR